MKKNKSSNFESLIKAPFLTPEKPEDNKFHYKLSLDDNST